MEKGGGFLFSLSRKSKKAVAPCAGKLREEKLAGFGLDTKKPTSLEAIGFSIECDSNEA